MKRAKIYWQRSGRCVFRSSSYSQLFVCNSKEKIVHPSLQKLKVARMFLSSLFGESEKGYKNVCSLVQFFPSLNHCNLSRYVVVYWININNVLNVHSWSTKKFVLFGERFFVLVAGKNEEKIRRKRNKAIAKWWSLRRCCLCPTLIALKPLLCWQKSVFFVIKKCSRRKRKKCCKAHLYSRLVDSLISVVMFISAVRCILDEWMKEKNCKILHHPQTLSKTAKNS